MSKLVKIGSILVAASIAATPAVFAEDEHNTVPGLTAAGAPLGAHGIDTVAFIGLGNRTDGVAKYTAVHDGVAYYFVSEENKKAFEANPGQYVPQNGGFCTFGVSVGKKFDGNPRYAAVRDGKLYLFLSDDILQAFLQDEKGTIRKANANWKKIKHTAATDL